MSPSLTDMFRGGAPAASTLLRGHNGGMSFVGFISEDQVISASDEDRTIRHWTLSNEHGKVMREPVVCATATSPNGRWLAMGGRDGKVKLLDLRMRTLEIMKSVEKHTEVIKSLSFSPDSSQLASGAQDGTMLVWFSTTLKKIAGPFKGHRDAVWCVCYSPDGRKIASCDREVIQVWDSTAWTRMDINAPAWSLSWSSDGRTLFAGCVDGTIKVYDGSTGTLYVTRSGHGDVVFAIALSHNGKFIASASWDKTVRFWEATTLQHIGPNLVHDAKIHSISISPDDSRLVSGARDAIIRIWNLRTVAPTLFRDFLLEPNRAPSNGGSLTLFPSWHIRTRDLRPSNGSSHESLSTPRPLRETHENSDNSSPQSIRSRQSILDLFRSKRDTIDDPRTRSPSSQGSTYTHSSNSSIHILPGDQPLVLSPIGPSPISSSSQNFAVNSLPSPIRPRRHAGECENAGLIREIRSKFPDDLTGCIVPEGNHPVAGGSHGDVYKGTFSANGRSIQVAIKVIKKYTAQGDDLSKQRRLRREIELWLKLDHKNVIPLLGTTEDYGDFAAMVCPWVENGSLSHYLDRHKDLTAQQRLGIINDVALGLQYLHSQKVVHGDISGSNILVYSSGRACLSDFGLSIVVTEIEGSSIALTYQTKGTVRWTAPELLQIREPENDGEDGYKVFPTRESDMYSFGGVMFHVLSNKVPYHYLSRDPQVVVAISKGERPKRLLEADAVTDDRWRFMMTCWSFEAADRPSVADTVAFVYEQLLGAVAGSRESTLQIRSETVNGE